MLGQKKQFWFNTKGEMQNVRPESTAIHCSTGRVNLLNALTKFNVETLKHSITAKAALLSPQTKLHHIHALLQQPLLHRLRQKHVAQQSERQVGAGTMRAAA